MKEAVSQDIRKGMVFFLKKTTNFCTATIFDIHLVKRTKGEGAGSTEKQHSSCEIAKAVLAERKRSVGARKSKSSLKLSTLLATYKN